MHHELTNADRKRFWCENQTYNCCKKLSNSEKRQKVVNHSLSSNFKFILKKELGNMMQSLFGCCRIACADVDYDIEEGDMPEIAYKSGTPVFLDFFPNLPTISKLSLISEGGCLSKT